MIALFQHLKALRLSLCQSGDWRAQVGCRGELHFDLFLTQAINLGQPILSSRNFMIR